MYFIFCIYLMLFQVPYGFIILLIFKLTRTHFFVIYYREGNIITFREYTTHLVSVKCVDEMGKRTSGTGGAGEKFLEQMKKGRCLQDEFIVDGV